MKDDSTQTQHYVLTIALPFIQFLMKHLYLLGTFILSNVHCYTLIRPKNDQISKWCMKFEKCMKLAQILAESRVIIAQRLLYVGVTKYPKKIKIL